MLDVECFPTPLHGNFPRFANRLRWSCARDGGARAKPRFGLRARRACQPARPSKAKTPPANPRVPPLDLNVECWMLNVFQPRFMAREQVQKEHGSFPRAAPVAQTFLSAGSRDIFVPCFRVTAGTDDWPPSRDSSALARRGCGKVARTRRLEISRYSHEPGAERGIHAASTLNGPGAHHAEAA
jgi:hypothetical protein